MTPCYRVVFLLVLGAAFILPATATATSPYYVDPAGRITVANEAGIEGIGGVSGDTVVWQNYSTGRIYVRDLSDPNATPRQIGPPGAPANTRISGNHIVWHDSNVNHVYAADISLAIPLPMQLSNSPTAAFPEISGNTVVWQDWRAGDAGIYGFDLDNPAQGEYPIIKSPHRLTPAISGQWLTWRNEGTERIFAVDLSVPNSPWIMVESNPWAIGFPKIDGSTIVYNESKGSNDWDVGGYDLDGGGRFPILTSAIDEGVADVWGDIVLYWQSDQPGDLFGLDVTDIDAGHFTIPAGSERIGAAGIADGWIVYREGDDVYANRLLPEPATLLLLAGGMVTARRPRRR